jgi:hypothetical protein
MWNQLMPRELQSVIINKLTVIGKCMSSWGLT